MNQIIIVGFLCVLIYFSEPTCDNIIVSDFSIDSCINMATDNTSYYYWVDENSQCIPTCKPYKTTYSGKQLSCVPGYSPGFRCCCTSTVNNITCKHENDNAPCGRTKKCVQKCFADTTSCASYYINNDDVKVEKKNALFKPTCQNDGSWKPKQCKGGVSGKCICFDKSGKRLFGDAKYSASKDMTCACSRRKADLIDSGRPYVSFHCNNLGNYEPLQCDSGLCWCAEEKTGDIMSVVVPEKAMTKLPCYNQTLIGSKYLRKCESLSFAIAEIGVKLKKHGITYVNYGVNLCDGDGAYGSFSISDGIAKCTWRDGTQIETWSSDASIDIAGLNCNCARDFKKYGQGLVCDGRGNYREYQTLTQDSVNYYFCIDNDGFKKTGLIDEKPSNCSLYY